MNKHMLLFTLTATLSINTLRPQETAIQNQITEAAKEASPKKLFSLVEGYLEHPQDLTLEEYVTAVEALKEAEAQTSGSEKERATALLDHATTELERVALHSITGALGALDDEVFDKHIESLYVAKRELFSEYEPGPLRDKLVAEYKQTGELRKVEGLHRYLNNQIQALNQHKEIADGELDIAKIESRKQKIETLRAEVASKIEALKAELSASE